MNSISESGEPRTRVYGARYVSLTVLAAALPLIAVV
jgi:hypothetical protein